MSKTVWVTSVTVAAAKLKIKRAKARGLPISAATQAIADARPAHQGSGPSGDVAEGRTG